jgi:prepilin-type processing-associated H-X9-DG protein
VDRTHIFACPSTVQSKLDTPTYGTAAVNGNVYSYGLNCLSDTTDAENNIAWKKPFRSSDVVNPARTFMVAETSFPLGTSGGYRDYYGLLPHRGAANFAFFDGHVERRAKSAIPDYSTATNRRFWTGQ